MTLTSFFAAEQCSVFLDGLESTWIGRKTRFEISICDASGTRCDSREPVVVVEDANGTTLPCLVAMKSTGFYRVTFTPVAAVAHRVTVRVDHATLLRDHVVSVRARAPCVDDIDGRRCVVRGDAVRQTVCGAAGAFDVELRDADGAVVALDETSPIDFIGLLECRDCDDVDVDSTLRARGILACSFLAPVTPGDRLLHLSIGESMPIAASPYTVRVVPADAVGRTCFLKPAFPSHPELAATASATLVAVDRFGNCSTAGGASVDVRAVVSDGRADVECAVAVDDLADGQYRIAVTCEALGPLRVTVSVNGEPILRSPFDLLVVKPAAAATAAAAAVASAPAPAIAGRTPSQSEFDERSKRLSAAMAEARNKRMSALFVGDNAVEEWRRSTAGNMAVHDAALVGNLGAVKQLLDEKASVDVHNDDNRTPLYLAAWSGQLHVAEWLVDRGADVNHRTKQGYTPLFACADRDHLAVVELLVVRGKCNVDALADDGTGALYHAAAKGYARVCRLMLLHGADADAGLAGRWKPLHGAVFHTRIDAVRTLLDGDVDVDVNAAQTDSLKGYAPLHLAVARQKPFVAAIDLLLARAGINVDATTSTGQTALHLAAMWGHVGVCEKLVLRGASLSARNKKGRTPLEMAVKDQKEEAAAYLRAAMGAAGAAAAAEALVSPRRTAIRKAVAPQSPGDALQSDLEAAAAEKRRAKGTNGSSSRSTLPTDGL
jgi:ankyrin repeat protein